jgi:hypothetical protein
MGGGRGGGRRGAQVGETSAGDRTHCTHTLHTPCARTAHTATAPATAPNPKHTRTATHLLQRGLVVKSHLHQLVVALELQHADKQPPAMLHRLPGLQALRGLPTQQRCAGSDAQQFAHEQVAPAALPPQLPDLPRHRHGLAHRGRLAGRGRGGGGGGGGGSGRGGGRAAPAGAALGQRCHRRRLG